MTMSVPGKEELTYTEKMHHRAVLARLGVFMVSTYMIIASFSFEAPRDVHLFQIPWLSTQWVFISAGILGYPMIFWPRFRNAIVPWLFVLGLACMGRSFSIIFGGDLFSRAERLRGSGWATMWVLSLAAALQIQAAEILRTRRDKWSG